MVQNTSMLANNRHWPLRHYVIITSLFPSHPQGDMPSPNTWDTAADAPEACHASVVLRVPCTALRPWPRWGRCGWGWHRLAAPRLIQFRYNVPRAIINHARLRVNRGYIIIGYAPIWDDVKWPPDGWFVVFFLYLQYIDVTIGFIPSPSPRYLYWFNELLCAVPTIR